MAETIPEAPDQLLEVTEYTVENGSKQVTFAYPSYCSIEDEDDLGVIVRLDEFNYVSVSIPPREMLGTEKQSENIGDDSKLLMLHDDMHVFAVHSDDNHHWHNADIVELGINLPDDIGLIVNATAEYGNTEIYDVLLTIIESVTDVELLKDWLTNEWIPYVLP